MPRLLCYILGGHRYHIEGYTLIPFRVTWHCARCGYRCVVPRRKEDQEYAERLIRSAARKHDQNWSTVPLGWTEQ
jgi:hypothetical protein